MNVSFTYMIQMNAGISTANITLIDLLTNPSKLGQFNISAVNTSSNVIVSFSQPNPTASQSNISVTAGIVSKSQIITVRGKFISDNLAIWQSGRIVSDTEYQMHYIQHGFLYRINNCTIESLQLYLCS